MDKLTKPMMTVAMNKLDSKSTTGSEKQRDGVYEVLVLLLPTAV